MVYTTFFEWGALQYLVKEVAPRSKLFTRMILALSASEMHNSGLKNDDSSIDKGLIHYTQGPQELLKKLSGPTQEEDKMMMIFLTRSWPL